MMYHITTTRPLTRARSSRWIQLSNGLLLYGISIAFMLNAGLGVDSWDVLHQGLAHRTGVSFGLVVAAISLLVLGAWIPIRQRPGFGTLANAVVVGLVADVFLSILPEPGLLRWQIPMLLTGIALNGIATGLYIGAGMGPGPRDGLMTGLAARAGRSIRSVRTMIEFAVLAVGWTLGGPVGVGTVLYAVLIGPIAEVSISRFSRPVVGR